MKNKYAILLTVVFGFSAAILYYFNLNTTGTRNEFTEEGKSLNWKSGKTDKPDEFTKYFQAITTPIGEASNNYSMGYKIREYNSAKKQIENLKSESKFTVEWTQRGPANVGGRTRGLIVDPDDATHNTWFAGAATGGIWKTTDGGNNWICLTDDQPNLSANTLAMAASNHDIIYAGTGESFPGGTYMKGSGIYKSTDKGNTWDQLESTANNEDFAYINRLVIDPDDPNIVIVATEKGILKTINGGTSWTNVYSSNSGIEDLDADPTDFNKVYATEHGVGLVKSIDAGNNWELSVDGLEQGLRYELAISPVNPAKIYLSINTTGSPIVYRSTDEGETWQKFKKKDTGDHDYLGGQGEYDNIITCHPYDEDIAFLGGVNLFKVDFSDPGTNLTSEHMVYRVDQIDTRSFLSFIDFGGDYLGGGMDFDEEATNITLADLVSVEIRFGNGLMQKAHRFEVPPTSGSLGDGGRGVAASDYEYKDYVDVPFQAWDVVNNKQLMISFRDQERDGEFNLFVRDPNDDVSGREYFYVHLVDYNETTPSTNIAIKGGHTYNQMYFFWPTLASGGTWDKNNLPESKLIVKHGTINETKGSSFYVSNAYNSEGPNPYSQGLAYGSTSIPGLHPDHHNLVFIKTDEVTKSFMAINANDGGLSISTDNAETFTQKPKNYITTQFYGVAKKPGKNEYIGGMQDNGTWQSPISQDASSTSNYLFRLGGDGFECMWNYADENKIIGSIYNNQLYRSIDGGKNFYSSSTGITAEDGPFITRISSHINTPDVLYTVGKRGIYKSTNFGTNWTNITIGTGWLPESYTAVTSQHNVEVSLANENIVWAGAAMASSAGWKIFVSTNRANSFTAVNESTLNINGFISGIATHPFKDSTAYLLFSLSNKPKILRTEDLGKTWEDISGFGSSSSSNNGFPDVVVHSLVVLPNDPSTIWVGTDIGLFESNDNGETWHYANNGLPAVSVYDMFVQDGQVVIATHGRGIWTATFDELNYNPVLSGISTSEGNLVTNTYYNTAFDSVQVFLNDELYETIDAPASGSATISCGYTDGNEYKIHIIAYLSNTGYQSNNVRTNFSYTGFKKVEIEKLKVYPNPTSGNINIEIPEEINGNVTVDIYSLTGAKLNSQKISKDNGKLDISNLNNGIYLLRMEHNGKIYSQKVKLTK